MNRVRSSRTPLLSAPPRSVLRPARRHGSCCYGAVRPGGAESGRVAHRPALHPATPSVSSHRAHDGSQPSDRGYRMTWSGGVRGGMS